jgi:peptidyl-prolyl cis-trans isomerase B (cyclophilin B)
MKAAALLSLVLLALAGCGGDDDDQAGQPSATTATATEKTAAGGCRKAEVPAPEPEGSETPPGKLLDPKKTYTVTVKTNCGDFTITLDPKASPKATASFVELARNDFYDGTYFHRIVPDFVIQGGDPTGTGGGGPGYTTRDIPAKGTFYIRGVVAMAKAADEPPGTAGSQFFIVTALDSQLPPEYALIGRVTGGKDVVARVGRMGDPNTELPTRVIRVDDMVVRVS